jgi:signal transduction histidine kinase
MLGLPESSKYPSIRIRTSRVCLGKSAYVRITIADTGTGIPAEVRNRIVEAFFTTKDSLGTGLGLWISQQIVHKHKGRIRVRSALRRGTAFSIFLPDAQSEHSATVVA